MWSTCPASSTQRIPSLAVDYRHPPDPVAGDGFRGRPRTCVGIRCGWLGDGPVSSTERGPGD